MNTRKEAGNISAVIFNKNLRKKVSNNIFDKQGDFWVFRNLIAL